MSQNSTKTTNKRKPTTKQEENNRFASESEIIAAVTSNEAKEGEKGQTGSNPHSECSTASSGQKKQESEQKPINSGNEKGSAKVDYIVNKDWKSLVPLLDSTGVLISKTVKDLLKLYPSDKVEQAIAIVKSRKREQHIPNLSGYFVAALKGDWASNNLAVEDESDREVDKGAVFRHWYDLARSLGYCSGQEIREGVQFVCLSGVWETWKSAVERGYSLDYLKKVVKRSQS